MFQFSGVQNEPIVIFKDENNDHTHTSIRRNTILSLVCFAVNYALVFICIYMLAVSIWTLFAQRNGGLRAFVASEGVGLRSPIALGLCLLIASISGIVNAIVLGVGEVAPSIVEGLQVDGRRKAFVMHQVLSTIALVLFSLVLMSTIPPLSQLTHSGVTATTWRDMATSYPRGICEFQISHQCAGFMNFMCASDTASTSVACPGHYCSSECRISPRHTVSNSSECRACVLFTNSPLLLRCKTNEDRRSSSYSCRLPLRRVVRRFFLVIIVSTSIALIWSLIVVLSSILSPLLST